MGAAADLYRTAASSIVNGIGRFVPAGWMMLQKGFKYGDIVRIFQKIGIMSPYSFGR
jgi:hypothetical protein